jgi:NitT/TauT family transport system permease protein
MPVTGHAIAQGRRSHSRHGVDSARNGDRTLRAPNTRASYLDVARTLGARRAYLIFRIAIPAALPSIFIGLFMGLGTSFLILVVAETVGVKSGLGWYLSWAQGWAEYSKVYGALVIMAASFSTIMTVLFKVRNHVVVWQKGVIKW